MVISYTTNKTVLTDREKTRPDIERERTRLDVKREGIRPADVERIKPDIEAELIKSIDA